ncbi:hypothetical protein V3C99_001720, partial [Haemonchus contortus]
MEQRGLFDFCLKRTDESFSSNTEPTLSEVCYSDESDSAIQGQAAQQEALVYAEQYEKSYEKARERKKLYQALEKGVFFIALEKYRLSKTKPADYKSAYCMDNPKPSSSV